MSIGNHGRIVQSQGRRTIFSQSRFHRSNGSRAVRSLVQIFETNFHRIVPNQDSRREAFQRRTPASDDFAPNIHNAVPAADTDSETREGASRSALFRRCSTNSLLSVNVGHAVCGRAQ